LVVLSTFNSNASRYELVSDGSADVISAKSVSSSSVTVTALSTTVATADTWSHACAVFTSTTSRDIYLNGADKQSNTTSNAPGAPNRTNIGCRQTTSSGRTNYFIGDIAEVAIWHTALTGSEVLALYSGVLPRLIAPIYLVGYWPLWGLHNPEIDVNSSISGTINNMTVSGTTVANHAPITTFTNKSFGLLDFIMDSAVDLPYSLQDNAARTIVRVI
jgi:hypothetical protein